jgi:hypothetical protein
MAPKEALCRIRGKSSLSSNGDGHGSSATEPVVEQPDHDTSAHHDVPLLALCDCPNPHLETRLRWAAVIAKRFLNDPESDYHYGIRDWDLVLDLDGSIENVSNRPSPSTSITETQHTVYPARYRLPKPITDRLSSGEERIRRAELFALGSLLYECISCKRPFHDRGDDVEDDEEIQSRYAKGEFPDDIWGLPMAMTILGCWCLEFAMENGTVPFALSLPIFRFLPQLQPSLLSILLRKLLN